MNALATKISEYALKEEIRALLDEEILHSEEYASTSRVNALGETSKQQFEHLLLETDEEGRQYPDGLQGITPPEQPRDAPYWRYESPVVQGLYAGEHVKPYLLPSRFKNVIPTHTVTQSTPYDSKYSPHRLDFLQAEPTTYNNIANETHWRHFKGVKVAKTVDIPVTGDDILRSMGLLEPRYIQQTPSFNTTTPPQEFDLGRKTFDTKPGDFSSMESPMTLIAIQSKLASFPVTAAISNSTFKKTEENLDKLSKGE